MSIGDLKFHCDDLDKEVTIKEYLKAMLLKLWEEAEGFSGKRPFGNSGWEYDLFVPLIKNGIIDGKFDEDGGIEECDVKQGNKVIAEVINSL